MDISPLFSLQGEKEEGVTYTELTFIIGNSLFIPIFAIENC